MDFRRSSLAFLLLLVAAPFSFAGNEMASSRLRDPSELDMPSLEIAAETSYLGRREGSVLTIDTAP